MTRPAGIAQRRVRLDGLTALRFFAALAVAVCHFANLIPVQGNCGAALLFGQYGVDFFFVLSGFVIAWSWNTSRPKSRFYWLRFARIWPLHLTVMLLLLLVGVRGTASHVVAELFLLQQWNPTHTFTVGLNGVSWTLAVEVFFYLLFPLVMPQVARWSTRRLAAFAATGWLVHIAWTGLAHTWVDRGVFWLTSTNPAVRLPQFFAGMTAAILLSRANTAGVRPRTVRCAQGAALGAVGVAWCAYTLSEADDMQGRHMDLWTLVATPLAVGLIAAWSLAGVRQLSSPARWLVTLGEWSFALYLVHHVLIYRQLWPYIENLKHAGAAGILLTAAIATSGITYRLVENPAEHWLRARGPRESAPADAA